MIKIVTLSATDGFYINIGELRCWHLESTKYADEKQRTITFSNSIQRHSPERFASSEIV